MVFRHLKKRHLLFMETNIAHLEIYSAHNFGACTNVSCYNFSILFKGDYYDVGFYRLDKHKKALDSLSCPDDVLHSQILVPFSLTEEKRKLEQSLQIQNFGKQFSYMYSDIFMILFHVNILLHIICAFP